jgi:hypothetical protein
MAGLPLTHAYAHAAAAAGVTFPTPLSDFVLADWNSSFASHFPVPSSAGHAHSGQLYNNLSVADVFDPQSLDAAAYSLSTVLQLRAAYGVAVLFPRSPFVPSGGIFVFWPVLVNNLIAGSAAAVTQSICGLYAIELATVERFPSS